MVGIALFTEAGMGAEWKEILLLVLGAFIASYGKIIDFWFQKSDADTAIITAVDDEPTAPVDNSPIGGGCTCGMGSNPYDNDGDGIPNYLDSDSDNDGISDKDENLG